MNQELTPEQQELLDISILRVLERNHTRFGLQPTAVATLVVQYGFHPDNATALDRMEYLTSKGMAEEALKTISKANRAWRITQAGRQFLDERGY